MPLYSELYHNYVGNTPIIPTPMVSVGTSTYSPPTYVGVSRAFPNPLGVATRTAQSFTRGYVPKLTPITETPLTSTRIAALGRVRSPKFLASHPSHHSSPTYQKPRRTINTADIDVSATKYAGATRSLATYRHAPVSESPSLVYLSNSAASPLTTPILTTTGSSSIGSISTTNQPGASAADGERREGTLSERDLELSDRNEQRRARSTINRNRTVVRLNTIRARSRSRGSRGSEVNERGGGSVGGSGRAGQVLVDSANEPTFDDEMLQLEAPATRVGGSSTATYSWRDNFRGELYLRPRVRAEPIKSPGELLLEKHLIRDEEAGEGGCDGDGSVGGQWTPLDATTLVLHSPVMKRRGTIRRKSTAKIPSFHEICADISSDKLDDDLNAGELRRRASQLIEDELLQIQEELKKAQTQTPTLPGDGVPISAVCAGPALAASGMLEERLKEALEQQLAQDSGVELAEKRKLKKIKRTKTKPKLEVPGEQAELTESQTVVLNASQTKIVAEVESIEECAVFKLPKKKKKTITAPLPPASKGTEDIKRDEPISVHKKSNEPQHMSPLVVNRTEPNQSVQTSGLRPEQSKQASSSIDEGQNEQIKTDIAIASPGDANNNQKTKGAEGPTRKDAPEQQVPSKKLTGIKTYIRKKTVETLPDVTGGSQLPVEVKPKPVCPSIAEKDVPDAKIGLTSTKDVAGLPLNSEPCQDSTVKPQEEQVSILERKPTDQSKEETLQTGTFLEEPVTAEAKLVSVPRPATIVQTAPENTHSVVNDRDLKGDMIVSKPTSANKDILTKNVLKTTKTIGAANKTQEVTPNVLNRSGIEHNTSKITTGTLEKLKEASADESPGLGRIGQRKKPTEFKVPSLEEQDFWSAIGTRETVSFARRKQQIEHISKTALVQFCVVEEQPSPVTSPTNAKSRSFNQLFGTLPPTSSPGLTKSQPFQPTGASASPKSSPTLSQAPTDTVTSIATTAKSLSKLSITNSSLQAKELSSNAATKLDATTKNIAAPSSEANIYHKLSTPQAKLSDPSTVVARRPDGDQNSAIANQSRVTALKKPDPSVGVMNTSTLIDPAVQKITSLETTSDKKGEGSESNVSLPTVPSKISGVMAPQLLQQPKQTPKAKTTEAEPSRIDKSGKMQLPSEMALPSLPVLLDTKKLSPKELIKVVAPNIAAAAEKKLAEEKGKRQTGATTTRDSPTVSTTTTTATTATSSNNTITTTTVTSKNVTDKQEDGKLTVKKVAEKKVIKVIKTKATAPKAKQPEQEADRQVERVRKEAQEQEQQISQQNLERMQTKLNQITLNMGAKGLAVEVKECQKCQSAIVSESLPVAAAIVTTPSTMASTPKQPIANGAKLTKNKFGTLHNLSDLSSVNLRGRNSGKQTITPGASERSVHQQQQQLQKNKVYLSSSEDEAGEESASEISFSGIEDDWSSDEDNMVNDKPEKKKPFDPTKRVKLNFDQMRKCYSKEEKCPIVLVARPRPLWKVKRHGHRHNRNADLTSSSGSSGGSGSEDESTGTNTTDQTSSETASTMDGATSDINTDSSVNSSTGGKGDKGDKGGKGGKDSQGRKDKSQGKGAVGSLADPFGDIYDTPMVIPLHAEPRCSTSNRKSGSAKDENNNMPLLDAPDDEEERGRSIGAGHEVRSASTSSHDSGFYGGGTAPISPKKALDCDVNCHKKCEKLAANLCGVNQKLIVEALSSVRRGVHDARDSPSKVPPSANPAYRIETPAPPDVSGMPLVAQGGSAGPVTKEEVIETSYTYAQFQKTGKLTAPATVIPRFRKYNVDDFHFLTVLGKGSFGKVFLAELKNSDYYYAIKCLKKDVVLEDDDVDCTLIERKVLALGTKHPFLCHLFCTFQTDSHLFFVMEYLNGGDLMFHIQQSGRFPEARARFYAAEIVSGLKFLHRKGIVYRDLKLDNVLLDYDGHVRIADFGMCKLEIYLDKLADSFCGTPDYMAPEIIKGQKYNQAVDWWSFGVLVYEMLVGQSPFSGCDEDELFWSICNEIPWFPHYLSKEALRLLQSLLEKDASIRLGVLNTMDEESDIKYHPFFNSIIWDKLERRAVEPPFKPQVRHPLDTQYFDKQFTRERARLTPIDRNILASMDQAQFEGFTYTNPNNTLTKIREKQKKKQKKMYFCPQCGDIKVTYNIF